MSNYGTIALTIAGGLVAGAVGSLTMQELRGGAEPARGSHASMTPSRETFPRIDGEQQARLRALESRVEVLGHRASAEEDRGEVSSRPSSDELEVAELEMAPKEGYERALARWSSTLADFEADPLDPAWSGAAEASFDQDLRRLGDAVGFRLDSTECRTTRCVGRTTWNTHADAVAGFSRLLHHTYSLGCAREATLPEPSSGTEEQPYEVTVVFDCTELRAQG